MNIEKLGIKPIEWFLRGGEAVCLEKPVRKLEQQNREMLEALIEVMFDIDNYEIADSTIVLPAIQKADPKHRTWEEIKELIKNEI